MSAITEKLAPLVTHHLLPQIIRVAAKQVVGVHTRRYPAPVGKFLLELVLTPTTVTDEEADVSRGH